MSRITGSPSLKERGPGGEASHPRNWALFLLIALLTGCVDKYAPPAITDPPSYLVVDGFVNLRGTTTVRLSRTRALSSAARPVEAGATLAIRDEAGTSYPLTEQGQGSGTYSSAALALPAGRRYQLYLRTAAGRQYASDLVTGKLAPVIDSVTWGRNADGVQLYVNAHDPANATRYYRWTYDETWEYRSKYESYLEFTNGAIQPRTDQIYTCWQLTSSTAILQSSTEQLSRDVVSRFRLAQQPGNSQRFRIRYSVLVKQVAETADEYAYWEQLRKNTESLGTLFDPLPSQTSGNIRCLDDASERVLGYVGASSVTERRLFIDYSQFPQGTRFLTGYEDCAPLDTIPVTQTGRLFSNPNNQPVYATTRRIIGYAYSTADCVDCRRRGGTTVKPSFW